MTFAWHVLHPACIVPGTQQAGRQAGTLQSFCLPSHTGVMSLHDQMVFNTHRMPAAHVQTSLRSQGLTVRRCHRCLLLAAPAAAVDTPVQLAAPAACPANRPVSQAHQKLKPPMRPNTSNTSPHRYSPGNTCSTTANTPWRFSHRVLKVALDSMPVNTFPSSCKPCTDNCSIDTRKSAHMKHRT